MRVMAVAVALWKGHFRDGIVALEALAAGLFLGIILDPRVPHDWNYVALALVSETAVLTALSTGVMIGRSTNEKMDVLVLNAGRIRCYAAAVVAALLVAGSWLVVASAYVGLAVKFQGPVPVQGVWRLGMSLATTVLVTASLFVSFSPLSGGAMEPVVAVMLALLSLANSESEPWRHLVVLAPPLVENAGAAVGQVDLPLARNLAYSAAAIVVGLLRFIRREFIWSR